MNWPWRKKPRPGRDFATGDDSVWCGVCGKETSIAMLVYHLVDDHGIDPESIANAPIIDETDAP